jgi:hypothetical protein
MVGVKKEWRREVTSGIYNSFRCGIIHLTSFDYFMFNESFVRYIKNKFLSIDNRTVNHALSTNEFEHAFVGLVTHTGQHNLLKRK